MWGHKGRGKRLFPHAPQKSFQMVEIDVILWLGCVQQHCWPRIYKGMGGIISSAFVRPGHIGTHLLFAHDFSMYAICKYMLLWSILIFVKTFFFRIECSAGQTYFMEIRLKECLGFSSPEAGSYSKTCLQRKLFLPPLLWLLLSYFTIYKIMHGFLIF